MVRTQRDTYAARDGGIKILMLLQPGFGSARMYSDSRAFGRWSGSAGIGQPPGRETGPPTIAFLCGWGRRWGAFRAVRSFCWATARGSRPVGRVSGAASDSAGGRGIEGTVLMTPHPNPLPQGERGQNVGATPCGCPILWLPGSVVARSCSGPRALERFRLSGLFPQGSSSCWSSLCPPAPATGQADQEIVRRLMGWPLPSTCGLCS